MTFAGWRRLPQSQQDHRPFCSAAMTLRRSLNSDVAAAAVGMMMRREPPFRRGGHRQACVSPPPVSMPRWPNPRASRLAMTDDDGRRPRPILQQRRYQVLMMMQARGQQNRCLVARDRPDTRAAGRPRSFRSVGAYFWNAAVCLRPWWRVTRYACSSVRSPRRRHVAGARQIGVWVFHEKLAYVSSHVGIGDV